MAGGMDGGIPSAPAGIAAYPYVDCTNITQTIDIPHCVRPYSSYDFDDSQTYVRHEHV